MMHVKSWSTLGRLVVGMGLLALLIGIRFTTGYAAVQDGIANHVLGQTDFSGSAANAGGVSASSLNAPRASVFDEKTGRIFVADTLNNRVLRYASAAALQNGQAAELVLGQSDFLSNSIKPLDASALKYPGSVALDGVGNLFVADAGNNRVLRFSAPFMTGQAADLVLGQPDFNLSNQANFGKPNPSTDSLSNPSGLTFDNTGNLFVADTNNNRVLRYITPSKNTQQADLVLGQVNFKSNALTQASATTLNAPYAVAINGAGNVFVADTKNSRVLRYVAPFSNGQAANLVLGQADFTSGLGNRNGSASAATLNQPYGVAIDTKDNLLVADTNNNRVLGYAAPFVIGQAANQVVGQADFTSTLANRGGLPSAVTLNGPHGVALDGTGNLFVADTKNSRVLEYDALTQSIPTVTATATLTSTPGTTVTPTTTNQPTPTATGSPPQAVIYLPLVTR